MKSSKVRITHLIGKINDTLDDKDDVYGYAGINKDMLVASLKESYELLDCLKEYNTTFEVVFMKRKIASLIDKCCNYLKDPLSINTDNFNIFLTTLNQIRAEIKLTYIILVEKPIRLDKDIVKAQEELDLLVTTLNEIKEHKKVIEKHKEEADTIIALLESAQNEINENKSLIEGHVISFSKEATSIETTSSLIADWKEAIKKCQTEIEVNSTRLSEIRLQIEDQAEKLSIHQKDIDKQITSVANIDTTIKKQQEEIKETLAGANKHGMAGSFLTRKDELRKSLQFWQWATICSIIGLIVGAFFIVKPILEAPSAYTLSSYLSRLPIIIALVWLGWFCSKQYGYTARIREDYSYKYAISMAFEGYKKQAASINEELLNDLLRMTVENIGINPLIIYDTKNNHGSPINETVDNICNKVLDPIVKRVKKDTEND